MGNNDKVKDTKRISNNNVPSPLPLPPAQPPASASSQQQQQQQQQQHDDDAQSRAWELYSGVGLAPMVRASTTPLRALAIKYGADFCYTEELVDRSLIESIRCETKVDGGHQWIDYVKDVNKMSNKTRKKLRKLMQEQQQQCGGGGGGRGGKKEGETSSTDMIAPLLLRIDNQLERNKLICQIGTGEAELALQAALHVHSDVSAIDINMGCPKKFSVCGGMGSALLSDPDRACRIVRTLSQELNPLGKPVSVKIRLLKDTSATLDFITALIGAGANAVAIHGRRVGHEATQPADRHTLKEVVELAAAKFRPQKIPILINGDFYSRQDFTTFMEETGARGVLLARSALYNTSIFRKPPPTAGAAPAALYGYDSPLQLDKTKVIQDYLGLAARYNAHYRNIKYVVSEMMTHRRTPTNLISYMPIDFEGGGQTIGKVCDCKSLRDICRVWDVDYDAHVPKNRKQQQQQQQQQDDGTAAPAGEHRYSDSYFLNNNNGKKQEPSSSSSHAMNGKRQWQQLQKQETTTATTTGDKCNLPPSSASQGGGDRSTLTQKKPRVDC